MKEIKTKAKVSETENGKTLKKRRRRGKKKEKTNKQNKKTQSHKNY